MEDGVDDVVAELGEVGLGEATVVGGAEVEHELEELLDDVDVGVGVGDLLEDEVESFDLLEVVQEVQVESGGDVVSEDPCLGVRDSFEEDIVVVINGLLLRDILQFVILIHLSLWSTKSISRLE